MDDEQMHTGIRREGQEGVLPDRTIERLESPQMGHAAATWHATLLQ